MVRTVKVGLDVEEDPFVHGMGRGAKSVNLVEDALADAADQAKETTAGLGAATEQTDKLGDAADRAEDQIDDMRQAAAKLDRQAEELTRSLRELAVAQALTGDEKITEQINEQTRALAGLHRQRKLIGDVGGSTFDAAPEVAMGLSTRLGPLFAKAPLGPAGIALGAALALAAAPTVAAILGAAVIGGVGGAGIAGGIALSAQDPRVKSAASELKTYIGKELAFAAQPMVPAVVQALATIRKEFTPLRDDFRDIFAESADLLPWLTDGSLSGLTRIADGFHDLITSSTGAAPVVRELGHLFADVGDAVGDMLTDLSDDGDEAAGAIRLLSQVIVGAIRLLTGFIEVGSATFRTLLDIEIGAANVAEAFLGWIPFFGDQITKGRDNMLDVKAAMDRVGESGVDAAEGAGALSVGILSVNEAARVAADGAKLLDDTIRDLIGTQLSMDEANLAVKQGIADLNAALREGKRSLDDNSQAGRDNRAAILEQIGVLEDARQAQIDNGVEVGTANSRFNDGVTAIQRNAEKLGFNKQEVEKLIAAYRNIPGDVSTNVNANTSQARAAISNIVTYINSVDGKTATMYVKVRTDSSGVDRVTSSTGGGRVQQRWGGIREGHVQAREGVLRDAGIYAPASGAPARYAFAEPATGGEAFIPKNGNLDRSRSIAERVVQDWLGGAVQWRGQPTASGMAAAGGSVSYDYSLHVTPRTAVFSEADLARQQQRQEVRARVGRDN